MDVRLQSYMTSTNLMELTKYHTHIYVSIILIKCIYCHSSIYGNISDLVILNIYNEEVKLQIHDWHN